jgi:hypothetical protein
MRGRMPKFTYDDIVKIKETSKSTTRTSERAWVVAVVEDRIHFPLRRFPAGVVYSVEFEKGDAVDVHEDDLILLDRASPG